MPEEPPTRPARRTRPDADFRRRALGPAAPGAPAVRETLRDALARIPDLGAPDAPAAPEPAAPPAAPAARTPAPRAPAPSPSPDPSPAPAAEPPAPKVLGGPAVAPAGAAPAAAPAIGAPGGPGAPPVPGPAGGAAAAGAPVAPVRPPVPVPGGAPWVATTPEAQARQLGLMPADPVTGELPRLNRLRSAPSARHAPWWRRITFAAAIVGLVASIPVLGSTGYRLVTESTDGTYGKKVITATDPGYEQPVEPTPTALVIQNGPDGNPVALTFLSLSGATGGGTVLMLPLETAIAEPAFGVDRLSAAFKVLAKRPEDGRKQLAFQASSILNVGISEVIQLDAPTWSQTVAPLGAVAVDNPDPLDLGGTPVPTGVIPLSPDLVGPYLAALGDDESDLNRLNRQEAFWTAWMKAIAGKGEGAVAGETSAGIGLFARSLASGPVDVTTLPVTLDDATGRYLPNTDEVAALVLDAVPAPTAAYPGSRLTVRLLNGVAAEPIPAAIVRTVAQAKGTVTVVGNGPDFDRRETTIVYGDPARRSYAQLLMALLGGKGKVRLDREAPDSFDVTVVLGRDLLDGTTPDTTTSPSTEPTSSSVVGFGGAGTTPPGGP
jgi:hypothetical protein